jgi:hypothetical protein
MPNYDRSSKTDKEFDQFLATFFAKLYLVYTYT